MMGEARRKRLIAEGLAARSDAYPKKDTGIAEVQAPMSTGEVKRILIPEANRDEIQKHHWRGPRNSGENQPQNWTTAERKLNKFSGIHANMLAQQMEFWVLGFLEGTIELRKCTPVAFASMHEKIFATNGTLAEILAQAPAEIKREW